jgi:AcrR family transcriptional regulator
MSSLRARQKKARRDQIIEAARRLFVANGYSKTNMDAIADAAEVGVATIYIYFENKEGLVSALIQKDMLRLGHEADELLKSLPDDPAEAVIAILDIYRKFEDYVSYELMREVIIQAKSDGPVSDIVAWSHAVQVDGIRRALEHGQKSKTVSASLDTELAAGVIVDLLDRYISRLTSETGSATDPNILPKYIRLLFQNWLA